MRVTQVIHAIFNCWLSGVLFLQQIFHYYSSHCYLFDVYDIRIDTLSKYLNITPLQLFSGNITIEMLSHHALLTKSVEGTRIVWLRFLSFFFLYFIYNCNSAAIVTYSDAAGNCQKVNNGGSKPSALKKNVQLNDIKRINNLYFFYFSACMSAGVDANADPTE